MGRSEIYMILILLVLVPLMVSTNHAAAQESVTVVEPWGEIVGEIKFSGLKRTREYVVTRELVTRLGEPCLQNNLKQDQENLHQLDIFSNINVTTEVGPDGIIVHYEFVELLTFIPSLGLKFSDETGVSAGAGIKVPNLFGRATYLSARFLLGGYTELELVLDNPWMWGNRWGYKIEYYHREKDNLVADFFETSDEFYLTSGPNFGRYGRVGGIISLLSIRSDRDGITLAPNNHDLASRLGLYVGFDNLNAFVGTTEGWFTEIVSTSAIEIFENSSKYQQFDLDFRRYQPLADRHTLTAFSLTTVRSGKVGETVASWEQFGIGGTNTVRGWDFAARKGKNQMLNTLEYRYMILKPQGWDLPWGIKYRGGLSLAAFADYGIGWDEGPEFATDNFIDGYGLGLRLLLPIVQVARFDVAWGDRGKSVFIHLGSFEKATMQRRRVR